MRLSKLTLLLTFYIITSAVFASQLWDYLARVMGEQNFRWLVSAVFLSSAMAALILTIEPHFKLWKAILGLALVVAAAAYGWHRPFFVERVHVMQFALLGWLASRDLGPDRLSVRHMVQAMVFVLLTASLDELLQRFLPYRVGDIQDVITDAVSGLFGITLFLLRRAEGGNAASEKEGRDKSDQSSG